LIVDDDEEIRRMLADLFVTRGELAAPASGAFEAIEQLSRPVKPCVVFVDLMMPGVIGHSLIDFMRSEYPAIPIAIITASPQLAPAGVRVFQKPLVFEHLVRFVEAVCSERP
jgi:CheY-like chemotaxis protein